MCNLCVFTFAYESCAYILFTRWNNLRRSRLSPTSAMATFMTLQGVVMECPICFEHVRIMAFHDHMIHDHPATYVALLTTHFPFLTEDNLLDVVEFLHTMDQHHEPEPTYEELLQLCDEIGYEPTGVPSSMLDSIAPISCPPSHMDRCPICLEETSDVRQARTLRGCGHSYCDECISIWLSEHKSCPVCKKDVMVDANQIASMSKSSSSAPEGFLPSSSDALDVDPSPESSPPSMNTT